MLLGAANKKNVPGLVHNLSQSSVPHPETLEGAA
jgi:hypothetical protein